MKTLRGWLLCPGSDAENLEKLADELHSKGKFLGFKYHDYAGCYFFHPKDVEHNNYFKLQPEVKKINDHPTAKPLLYFIIYERKVGSFVPHLNGEPINPVLVEPFQDLAAENNDDSPKIKKKKIVETQQKPQVPGGFSPITSEEEEEEEENAPLEAKNKVYWVPNR